MLVIVVKLDHHDHHDHSLVIPAVLVKLDQHGKHDHRNRGNLDPDIYLCYIRLALSVPFLLCL